MQLSEWLQRAGVYASEFADRIGVSHAYLRYLRAGKRRPSLEVMRLIERATEGEVTMDDWLLVPSKRGAKHREPGSSGGPKKRQIRPVKKGRRNLTDTTSKGAELHGSDRSA